MNHMNGLLMPLNFNVDLLTDIDAEEVCKPEEVDDSERQLSLMMIMDPSPSTPKKLPSMKRHHPANKQTLSGSAETRTDISSVMRKRGRPACKAQPKPCLGCGCMSDEQDPVWLSLGEQARASIKVWQECLVIFDQGTMYVLMRWGYKVKDMKQPGDFCFYCMKTIGPPDVHRTGYDLPEAERPPLGE